MILYFCQFILQFRNAILPNSINRWFSRGNVSSFYPQIGQSSCDPHRVSMKVLIPRDRQQINNNKSDGNLRWDVWSMGFLLYSVNEKQLYLTVVLMLVGTLRWHQSIEIKDRERPRAKRPHSLLLLLSAHHLKYFTTLRNSLIQPKLKWQHCERTCKKCSQL